MKKLLLVLFLLITSLSIATNSSGQPSSQEIQYQLISIVKPILTGDYTEQQKSNIHNEAYIINHNSFESIFEVLNNPEKRKSIVEGKNMNFEFIKIRVTDDQQNAYMVFNTNAASWHSVLFEKDENSNWKIVSWHKS